MKRILIALTVLVVAMSACKKEDNNNCQNPPCDADSTRYLIFKMKLDPNQERLNNLGFLAEIPANHDAQTPDFKGISAHYIELAQDDFTQVGAGNVLYKAEETNTGGANAIDFDKSTIVKDGEVFFKIPLRDVTPGTYKWLRVSLAYQAYEVKVYINETVNYNGNEVLIDNEFPCYVSSFIGFNNYIKNVTVKDTSIAVNSNKKQGFWITKTYGTTTVWVNGTIPYEYTANEISVGQAPEGATTVVNPNPNSPIPAGSCLVTGAFSGGNNLTITGNEQESIVVEVSLSINKSFEWVSVGARDGKYEPLKGEAVVDMGIRGMIPTVK